MFQLESNNVTLPPEDKRFWLKKKNITGQYGGKFANVYVPSVELLRTVDDALINIKLGLKYAALELVGKRLGKKRKTGHGKNKKWIL